MHLPDSLFLMLKTISKSLFLALEIALPDINNFSDQDSVLKLRLVLPSCSIVAFLGSSFPDVGFITPSFHACSLLSVQFCCDLSLRVCEKRMYLWAPHFIVLPLGKREF